jgi:transposase
VAIVMGLDQHRAQITADWLNTETGEVSRARVTPAHRDGVRQFLGRFAGQRLEVALEATTGWRFVVEELQAVGADAHLAEPAEASSLRGSKKRATTRSRRRPPLARVVDGRAAAGGVDRAGAPA